MPSSSSFLDDRASRRRRAIALALAILVNVAILLMLMQRIVNPPRRVEQRLPVSFTMAPANEEKEASAQAGEQTEKPSKEAEASPRPRPTRPTPTPTPPPPVQVPSKSPLPFIEMDSDQMASSDIGKMAKRADAGNGQGAGTGATATYGPGEGPGGQQLYPADWYREPTDAELAGYLPSSTPPEGWGLVACKTIENFQVDNCQTLGESPLGSGFARAVRQAAWQFRVRPPRVNGQPQIGAWVRIRIDYRRGTAVIR